jgi:cysteinyl-tRNA synthetase
MKLYNSLTRRVEPVVPLEPGHLRLYTCGPTVYDYAHIGNFRAYVFEDILRRTLRFAGFRVTQVMNLTDVDDKTIRGARAAGVPLAEYTRPFKEAFFADLKTLAIEPAEHYPAATDHVPEMIALIERLLANGVAYRSDDGSVYFRIAAFPEYGKLARLDRDGMQAGARVAQDEYEKENAADFALWKAWSEADGAVAWDSPWGRGRPGWHIECSAMSMRYLGESFDIHTGGIDNLFPHHDDEIAQSEAATGKPFVRTWVHCNHLNVDGQKMSKSMGNFYTLRDLLTRGYTGRQIRYVLLGAQYRQALNFTFGALDAAGAALARIDGCRERLRAAAGNAEPGALPEWGRDADTRFRAAMEDDLNVPEALAALFALVTDVNRALDEGSAPPPALRAVDALLDDWNRVLAVLEPERAPDAIPADVLDCVRARAEARAQRNWAEADRLRDALAERGWDVRDTPEGPKLKPRPS